MVTYLITAVADGVVTHVAPSRKESFFNLREVGCGNCGLKFVSGVVTMFVGAVAMTTEIKVFTVGAGHEFVVGEADDAVVAGTESTLDVIIQGASLVSEGTGHLLGGADVLDLFNLHWNHLLMSGLGAHLGLNALSSAGNKLSAHNKAFNKPMILAVAKLATINAALA